MSILMMIAGYTAGVISPFMYEKNKLLGIGFAAISVYIMCHLPLIISP